MPVYQFYPTLKNGLSPGLEAVEAPNDEAAIGYGDTVLARHGTAESVVVYAGNRQVHPGIRRGQIDDRDARDGG